MKKGASIEKKDGNPKRNIPARDSFNNSTQPAPSAQKLTKHQRRHSTSSTKLDNILEHKIDLTNLSLQPMPEQGSPNSSSLSTPPSTNSSNETLGGASSSEKSSPEIRRKSSKILGSKKNSPLHYPATMAEAIAKDDIDAIQYHLLKVGNNVNAILPEHNTSLVCFAFDRSAIKVLLFLIEKGALLEVGPGCLLEKFKESHQVTFLLELLNQLKLKSELVAAKKPDTHFATLEEKFISSIVSSLNQISLSGSYLQVPYTDPMKKYPAEFVTLLNKMCLGVEHPTKDQEGGRFFSAQYLKQLTLGMLGECAPQAMVNILTDSFPTFTPYQKIVSFYLIFIIVKYEHFYQCAFFQNVDYDKFRNKVQDLDYRDLIDELTAIIHSQHKARSPLFEAYVQLDGILTRKGVKQGLNKFVEECQSCQGPEKAQHLGSLLANDVRSLTHLAYREINIINFVKDPNPSSQHNVYLLAQSFCDEVFNKIVYLIVDLALNAKNDKHRIDLISCYIYAIEELLDGLRFKEKSSSESTNVLGSVLGSVPDLHGATLLFAALNMLPLSRLKLAFANLPENLSQKLNLYREILDGNYTLLRPYLRKNLHAIPPLALFGGANAKSNDNETKANLYQIKGLLFEQIVVTQQQLLLKFRDMQTDLCSLIHRMPSLNEKYEIELYERSIRIEPQIPDLIHGRDLTIIEKCIDVFIEKKLPLKVISQFEKSEDGKEIPITQVNDEAFRLLLNKLKVIVVDLKKTNSDNIASLNARIQANKTIVTDCKELTNPMLQKMTVIKKQIQLDTQNLKNVKKEFLEDLATAKRIIKKACLTILREKDDKFVLNPLPHICFLLNNPPTSLIPSSSIVLLTSYPNHIERSAPATKMADRKALDFKPKVIAPP